MDGETFEWFLAVIREMDAEYLGIRTPPPPGSQIVEETATTNHRGIRGLLRRLAKKPAQPLS